MVIKTDLGSQSLDSCEYQECVLVCTYDGVNACMHYRLVAMQLAFSSRGRRACHSTSEAK
jgi:hypothetical protein